ncbi:MAG TPA: adenylate/guanylate cyclase domain-containing protein [Anaerolineaceae bacterium]|nr:adenylate/guanylate cyclase domain-containing protein [Anaerolineaceae bacterium]
MDKLPTGTVTFLYTDIEDSTRLWQEQPEAMSYAHTLHDRILHEAIEMNHGYVFQMVGDSFNVAFHTAQDALMAALMAQQELQNRQKDLSSKIKARMGLHTGSAEIQPNGNYEGYVTIASTQRVMSVAYGGQVLISHSTADLLSELPDQVSLRDMGEHQLKSLRTPLRLYQLVAANLPQDFPPIQSLNQFPNNLPTQLTSFIGREKEIAEIKATLETARLVTLTGSGGTGKTRLSQEAGAQLLTSFPHGVWLVELAPLIDESQVIPALAQVFGLQELPFNPLAKLVEDYLRDKKLLLILDNCEHLIAACARLADHWLHQCAGLKILASSREALGIAGEIAYRTPSLAESESTQLFVERAHAANSNFKLTEANQSAVAQICHRLDGIPLAIELAAARTKLLSAEQIASRLDDMFRLLVGGSRTALPRQQTLRALIDWSYDLLSDEEKRLLQFASVFVGGWTLDALEFVAADPNTLELLEQLVNKSLVVTEEREGEMRYFMLETIRQYGREKLFEAKQAAAARDRHFLYFKNISSGLWDVSSLAKKSEIQRLKSNQGEMENLRAAFEWGLQNHVQDAVELAANMSISFSMVGGLLEGITILKSAMEKFRELPPVEGDANHVRKEMYARVCFSLGTLFQGTNEIMLSRSTLQEAIAIARELGDKHLLGLCLEMYASASNMIKADDTVPAAKEGLEIFRDLNYGPGLAMAYSNMARWETVHGDIEEGKKYMHLMRGIMDDAPVSLQTGFGYLGLGIGSRLQGLLDLAQQYFKEGLLVFISLGHKGMIAVMTSEIAHTQRAQGNFVEAKKTYQETIKVFQDQGNLPAVAHQLECFAMIAIVEEEPLRAAKLFGAADVLRERTGHQRTDEEEAEHAQFISRLRSMLNEEDVNKLWSEGRAMTIEQAIQMALG